MYFGIDNGWLCEVTMTYERISTCALNNISLVITHTIHQYISGEDAYLGSQLVPEYVKGVQSQKVIANIKCASIQTMA